jgi:predicted transport protein|tara:strand:+ start:4584 stop:5159 length:576 start_codon:yes stop_codon:yes gene_type:complete
MTNLKNYILHLDNWIPKNILDNYIKELSKNKTWKRHTYNNSLTLENVSKNGNKELDICFLNNFLNLEEFNKLIWKALEKYIVIEKIGGEELGGWNGFSSIRFNRYKKNQIMSKHWDAITTLFEGEKKGVPTLSIVGALNDDYEGGEFIMFDNYEIKFKPGDIIIFPSTFLYPHLVKPVKKGIRYSFVCWAY